MDGDDENASTPEYQRPFSVCSSADTADKYHDDCMYRIPYQELGDMSPSTRDQRKSLSVIVVERDDSTWMH